MIKLAYFSYRDYYLKFEELPSGNGYADIVYFPKKTSNLPALVVEMKWDKSAEGAITQIKKRNYPAAIKRFLAVRFCWLELIMIKMLRWANGSIRV